jgi:hypothetical protein
MAFQPDALVCAFVLTGRCGDALFNLIVTGQTRLPVLSHCGGWYHVAPVTPDVGAATLGIR